MSSNNTIAEINDYNIDSGVNIQYLLSQNNPKSQQQASHTQKEELYINTSSESPSISDQVISDSQDSNQVQNHDSVNNSQTGLVLKPKQIQDDDQVKKQKSKNIIQSQLNTTKVNNQNNKENESSNYRKKFINKQQQQLSTSISLSPYISSSNIRQNKNNNKSSIMNKENSENMNIQQKNMKCSPQNPKQNIVQNAFNCSGFQNKLIKEQGQIRSRSTNFILSPLREKHYNTALSSSLNVFALSCEKKQQTQMQLQLNNRQEQLGFQTQEFEVNNENQENIQFKQKVEDSIQNINIQNLNNFNGQKIEEFNSYNEVNQKEDKQNNMSIQENNIFNEQDCAQKNEQQSNIEFNTNEHLNNNSQKEDQNNEQKMLENNDQTIQTNLQILDVSQIEGNQSNNKYTTNDTQKLIPHENQIKPEQQKSSKINEGTNQYEEEQVEEQYKQVKNIISIDSFGAEEQGENNKQDQDNICDNYEQEIIESATIYKNDEEEEVKSQTIEHLLGYQSIIKETDNYLDQLLIYIAKEKSTLIDIQKSIQVRPLNRTTSPSQYKNQSNIEDLNHSQNSHQQETFTQQSNKLEDLKQSYQNDDMQDKKSLYYSQTEKEQESKMQYLPQSQQYSTQNSQKPINKNNPYISSQQLNQHQRVSKQYAHVNQMLNLSIESIKFGIVFPGNIFEEQVSIGNLTNETLFIKAVGLCLNPEFDSHGEYVYSIRKTINYDYNEKLMISIAPHSSVKVHVALKVPNITSEKILKGSFAVTINGYDSYIQIPITSSVEIPKILCTRQLFQASCSSKVIKLAIRRGKKSDCKIPFKNTYGYSLQIEPFWLTDQTDQKHITNIQDGSPCPFSLNLTPQTITVQPKGLFIINLLLRPNQYFKEYNEKRVLMGDQTPLHIKNILIIKISNSSLLLHFPMSLEVY